MQAQRSVNRGAHALPLPIPAPVGGLNARDALAAMPPTDASLMSNMFPYADRVSPRAGFTTLSTASSITKAGTVEGFRRLMAHVGGGTETALGAFYYTEDVAGTGRTRVRIYSIASDGTLATSREVITLASTDSLAALGEWDNFTSAAGVSYLFLMVTKQDAAGATFTNIPQAFDGTTWTAPSITGLPEFTLGVHSHRNRLWFYGSDGQTTTPKPLSVYYLPTGAVAGAVAEFNLGPFANKGGRVVSMRTWTIDGGDGGTDDMAAFVTDQGQVLLYEGTDPSNASTWRLVGVFDVGKLCTWRSRYVRNADPLFVRDMFAMKYGADVLILTQDGVTSLQRILRPQEDGDYTLSSKIRPLLAQLARAFIVSGGPALLFMGWKMIYLPILQQLFIFVPTGYASSSSTQGWFTTSYVMNTVTGAWTNFDGITGIDAVVVGSAIYFIDGGLTVKKYDGSALTDAGAAITFECRQAYNYLNSPTNKFVTLMQPMLLSSGAFDMTMQADADFKAGAISTYSTYSTMGNVQPWLSANQFGRAIAAHLKGTVAAGTLSWYATNYAYANSAGIV